MKPIKQQPNAPEQAPILTTVHLGVVGVDTGRVIIGDPGYIANGEPIEIPECSGDRPCQLDFKPEVPGLAIVLPSGYGDGLYPVHAVVDEEGIVHRVTTTFTETGDTPCAASRE